MFAFSRGLLLGILSAAVFVPASVGAATLNLRVTDTTGECGILVDMSTSLLDQLDSGVYGGGDCASGRVTSTWYTDAAGISILELSVNTTSSTGDLLVDAWYDGFGAAANDPEATGISLTSGASKLIVGEQGSLTVSGYVGADLVGTGVFTTQQTDEVVASLVKVLSDPFTMKISTILTGGSTTTYVAALTAAVPLPAAGMLLLSALGALGIARRRRSNEPAIA